MSCLLVPISFHTYIFLSDIVFKRFVWNKTKNRKNRRLRPVGAILTLFSLGNRRAPSSDLTGWIDAVSSTNIRDDSQCLMSSQAPGGFATSESIALSSTDGFKKDSQLSEQNFTVIPEFVRRVPQLVGTIL